MLLLKCKVSRCTFSGERICTFQVGNQEWDTCQSAWMCYRASDMKQAVSIPEDEEYHGLAKILCAGEDPKTGRGWVRYWFGHGTELKTDLDLQALRDQIITTDESTVGGQQ